jgi:hypothetical protein
MLAGSPPERLPAKELGKYVLLRRLVTSLGGRAPA